MDFDSWLAEMSDKLKRQGKSLQDILFDDTFDLIQGKYTIDTIAQLNYKAAVELCVKWFLQGKCFFQFEDLNKPYYLHTITIRWRTEENDVEIAMSELRSLSEKLNSNLIIDENGEWQLGTVIYKEKGRS